MSEQEVFEATVQREDRFTFVTLPFLPREVWGARPRYYVAGTINEFPVRGTLGAFKQEYFLRLSSTWLQKGGIEYGEKVTVRLSLENRKQAA